MAFVCIFKCFLSHLLVTFIQLVEQGQLHGGPCETRQICQGIRCLHNFFNSKSITRKCLSLKMKVKITEYCNHNGPIRWRISTSIKVILEHVFVSYHRFLDIHISNFVTLKMNVKVMIYNISLLRHSMANT